VSTVADISKLLQGVTPLIDELYTTPEEREQVKANFIKMAYQSDMGQMEVNAQEARNPSLFVSGWRPAIGWICVAALALSFLIFPIVRAGALYYSAFTGEHVPIEGIPDLDWGTLSPILMGMLGLGALRTFEKTKGVARN
jgi:hypothetical protein